jgi:acyl-CoA synthetase (AMP-forming)/AMP-acid ligase II
LSVSPSLTPSSARATDILAAVRRYANRLAVKSQAGETTFAELGQRAAALAERLVEVGVGPGDFVAVFLRNDASAVWTSFGVVLTGACEVQLNSGLTGAELRHCLSLTPPRVVVTSSAHAAGFRELDCRVMLIEDIGLSDPSQFRPKDVDADTLGRVNFTSGTSGLPKAIVTTHHRRWIGNLLFRASLPRLPGARSAILLVTPFSHGAGLFAQAYLGCGASIVLLDGMDMTFIESLLESRAIDAVFGSPTVLAKLALAFRGHKFDGIRDMFCGTAALPPRTYADIREIFGPVVTLTYGKTEVHSPVAQLPAEETEQFFMSGAAASEAACLGWPAQGVEVDVVASDGGRAAPGQPGEIRIRANHMSNGSIESKGFCAWDEAGRHATGDIGYFDEVGRLRLVGRSSDVIKSGGYKIFPAEIELALATAGTEAVVIGVPSTYWGEVIVAVCEAGGPTAPDRSALDESLASYKRPRAFITVSSLPRNGQGKVVRGQLLALIDKSHTLIDGPYPRFEPKT